MIDADKMDGAMNYLAETDLPFAKAKTDLLRCEILAKRIRARMYMTGEGSVEARKAAAEGSAEVIEADDQLIAATLMFEQLKARRSRAEIVVDVFRTLEASRRRS